MKSKMTIRAMAPAVLAFLWLLGSEAGSPKQGPSSVSLPEFFRHADNGPVQRRLDFGRLPLAFEPNEGQTAPEVQYLARGRGYLLFITSREAVLVLRNPAVPPLPARLSLRGGRSPQPISGSPTVLRLQLENSAGVATFEEKDKLPGASNYFLGRDPARWRTHIPQYGQVVVSGVYPGVDMAYHGNQGQLEYDFILKPGADPSAIRLRYAGVQEAQVTDAGDLEMETSRGPVRFRAPKVYQGPPGAETLVSGRYRLGSGGRVGFEVGSYDHSRPLVIDPVLDYSTYWGGTGADTGTGIALDPSGNAYGTGYTTSADFPVTNATQPFLGGTQNAFVDEIDPTGTVMLYSTYLGGSGTDAANGIQVDAAGAAYIVGTTNSADFPVTNALQAVRSNTYDNAFAAELAPGGASLVFSTYLGGSGSAAVTTGDYGQALALDPSGGIYLAGYTASHNFPVTNAYQAGLKGILNGFLAKLNPNGAGMVYSTYLGGSNQDGCFGVAADAAGDAYVTGAATSSDFPVTNAANLRSILGGGQNAFVTEVKRDGTALVYSTYLGGSVTDMGYGIAVDGASNAYVAGSTASANFPVTNAVQSALSNTTATAFLTEVAAGGASFVYSTYLGGSGNTNGYGDYALAVAADGQGDAYVAGYTGSPNFPTVNALQAANKSPYATAFIAQMAAGGAGMVYSTYLGGSTFDVATGIAVDNDGDAYITGTTYSTDFPVTAASPQTSLMGTNNAFMAEISQALPPTATPTDSMTPTPSPTASGTPTLTPTATPTSTGTLIPTSTPPPSDTPTPTSTPSATFTPTFTKTPTSSPTSTATPTPTGTPVVHTVTIGNPYPNPLTGTGPLSIPLVVPTGSTVEWSVFTMGFRKIFGQTKTLDGNSAFLSWNLKDQWGIPLADGLYYVRIQVTGPASGSRIIKVLVLQ